MDFSVLTAILGVVLAIIVEMDVKRKPPSLPLPPGPKKLPLLGNLFSMPSHSEWEIYTHWSKEYNSDIIHLDVAGTSIIILSSVAAAEDLLGNRSGSCRREHRHLFRQELEATGAARRFRPQAVKEARDLIRRLLNTPDAFTEHFEHVIGTHILSITYGLDASPSDDRYINAAIAGLRAIGMAAVPDRFLVDVLPILKYVPSWLPGTGFKQQALATTELLDPPLSQTIWSLQMIRRRKARRSRQLETLQRPCSGEALFTLLVFLLAMLLNPDAQRRVQQEIDSVVKPGHLPDFGDEEALPYVGALVKETLRWRPVAPTGIPHLLAVEDVYRGYRIPAGSAVIANSWEPLSTERLPDDIPRSRPERFLAGDSLNLGVRHPDAAFGFGRWICPGRHMAWDTVWIMIATMLAVFEITKPVMVKEK
ncbi:cytochrome P450 [Mycena vulgaris]|nr:cytochrome P450 [Mycena vulgaris]